MPHEAEGFVVGRAGLVCHDGSMGKLRDITMFVIVVQNYKNILLYDTTYVLLTEVVEYGRVCT